jgi:hypothetical protein
MNSANYLPKLPSYSIVIRVVTKFFVFTTFVNLLRVWYKDNNKFRPRMHTVLEKLPRMAKDTKLKVTQALEVMRSTAYIS